VEAKEEINAKKSTYAKDEAIALLKQVNEVYAAKGKNVVHLNLKKDKPSEDELMKLVLGPTGNLRAPTLRKGKTLIVGFDSETYDRLLGS
jgi:arsenate reductase-like glutaredoxin family protein